MNIKKLRNRKIFIITFLLLTICFIINFLPSLAKIKNRTPLDMETAWDGKMASSYRKGTGTQNDPYVIASGGELSYFSEMLKTTSYEGQYFTLSNDIILNQGIFSYDDGIKYTLNKSTFYVKEYSEYFYDNKELSGINIGSVNMINSLNNFKGHFDGNSHTIYGLYISKNDEELGLFTNLGGTVQNLYITNSLIYGGNITGGLASTAMNSSVENVLFSGSVIGNKEIKRVEKEFNLSINTDVNDEKKIIIPTEVSDTPGKIVESTLTGYCNNKFYINDNEVSCLENSFSLNVEDISSEMTISTDDEIIELNNLILKVKYDLGIAGGIIASNKNSNLKNVINKAQVESPLLAGGLIATSSESFKITSSYNKGNINSINKGGIVGEIKNLTQQANISLTYNDSNAATGFINTVSNSQELLTIENSFNSSSDSQKFIENITNSKVNLQNVYTTGQSDNNNNYMGSVNITTKNNLINKDFTQNTLYFNEFKDTENLLTNPRDQWIYEDGYLPTLYIDDIQNPLATLTVGTYSWNNLGFEENLINFKAETAFSIDEISNTRPIKEKTYYIAHTKKPLTKDEIDLIEWLPYENVVSIKDEGFYIVYAKVTDYNNRIYIINSDPFVIDTSGPNITLKDTINEWNSFKDDLKYVFIDSTTDFQIETKDELSGVKTIEYNISNNYKTLEELNTLNWITYSDNVKIENLGTNIINIKVTDNAGNISYINSDYIIYGGYNLSEVKVGESLENTDTINITKRSKISLTFTYQDSIQLENGENHYILASKPLPIGTKIILKDNKKDKIYTYNITSLEEKYAFTNFEEIGKGTMSENFKEESSNTIDENFSISIDFNESVITENIEDLRIYMTLIDSEEEITRSTIKNSIKSFNILTDESASLKITTSYNGSGIIYNSDSVEMINLTTSVEYPNISNQKIYDTIFDDMKLGLNIKLVDSEGRILPKEHLQNIKFKIGESYFTPNNDGITRIKISNNTNETTNTLAVVTSKSTKQLKEGTYYLEIIGLAAYDGLYSKNTTTESIKIPIIASNENETNNNYNFDVKPEKDYRVLFKKDKTANLKFNIIQNGEHQNPNIRIMLYKKDKLTAYDQSYTLINLGSYTANELEKITDSVFYAVKNPLFYDNSEATYNKFTLDLNLSEFKPGGYKLIFDLYDGMEKIGSLENKFIVR